MKTPDKLSEENDRLVELLTELDPTTSEYKTVREHIAANTDTINSRTPKRWYDVSGDTILLGAFNLGGILLILNHEVLHAVPSKALGFVTKLRI